MGSPNEHTDWAASAGPSEAKLDLKEPISEHDPNIGTRWGDPVDRSKPRVRVPREIDRYLDEPLWTCSDCGFQTLTETGKNAHLRQGGDGMTPCQREKARFKPVKNCAKCGGTGRGAGQCPSCSGKGEGSYSAKCRGCNGKGVLRDGDVEACTVCDGSGSRTYCADCSGSGEITHCGACGGSGKVQVEDGQAAPESVDPDALAKKISEPIIQSMKEGFLMIAEALAGGRGKAEKKAAKKKAKAARGGSESVSRGTAARGSEPVPAVEHPDKPMGDLPS
jgi:hypothetical protein